MSRPAVVHRFSPPRPPSHALFICADARILLAEAQPLRAVRVALPREGPGIPAAILPAHRHGGIAPAASEWPPPCVPAETEACRGTGPFRASVYRWLPGSCLRCIREFIEHHANVTPFFSVDVLDDVFLSDE